MQRVLVGAEVQRFLDDMTETTDIYGEPILTARLRAKLIDLCLLAQRRAVEHHLRGNSHGGVDPARLCASR